MRIHRCEVATATDACMRRHDGRDAYLFSKSHMIYDTWKRETASVKKQCDAIKINLKLYCTESPEARNITVSLHMRNDVNIVIQFYCYS